MADQSSEDWQKRFQQLAVQQEEDGRRHAEAEQTLCRTIIRVCAATGGLDPLLDPHLKRLRAAVKDGYSPQLEQRLAEFSDELVKAQDQAPAADPFERLVGRTALGGRQQKKALALWEKLCKSPADVSDLLVDELLGLLGQAGVADDSASDSGARGGGLFGRLLGGKGDAASAPNQTVAGLLDKVDWPPSLQEEIAGLSSQLSGDVPDDAWVGVVERLSDLVLEVMRSADNRVKAAGDFLAGLTARLASIDQHINSGSERRQASRDSGQVLGDTVRAEVGDISGSLQDSRDLDQLVVMVTDSLDRIQQQVERHLSDDATRHQAADRDDVRLRQSMAELEAEAARLRRRLAETEEQAFRDALTGLPNRRAYDDRVAEEIARLKRFGGDLSLVVWDLDNFKKINDNLGHKAGDKALKVVADLLASRLRETDFIARYGGEEFVVLLPGADPEAALVVAEQMREAVANAGLHSNNKPVALTVSGGIACFTADEHPDRVFEQADQALYQAKSAGKNRCVIAAAPGTGSDD